MKDQRGQALFEFILFFPIMLMLYAIFINIGNSLNASINQQKITRAYFFSLVKENSMAPKLDHTAPEWTIYSMFYNGWKESFVGGSADAGGQPLAPCYSINLPIVPADNSDNNCKSSYTGNVAQFIRPMTVFGACLTTYSKSQGADFAQRVPKPHCGIGIR